MSFKTGLYETLTVPTELANHIDYIIHNSPEIDLKNILRDESDYIDYTRYIKPYDFVEHESLQYARQNANKYVEFIQQIKSILSIHEFTKKDWYIQSDEVYTPIESAFYERYDDFPELNNMSEDEKILGRWIYDKTMLRLEELREDAMNDFELDEYDKESIPDAETYIYKFWKCYKQYPLMFSERTKEDYVRISYLYKSALNAWKIKLISDNQYYELMSDAL